MNKIWTLILVLSLFSCKKEIKKDVTIISGNITNQFSNKITLSGRAFNKTLSLNNDGIFTDTLNIEDGHFWLNDGKNNIPLYLQKGINIQLSYDKNNIESTYKVSGDEGNIEDYLFQKNKISEQIRSNGNDVYLLNESDYKSTFLNEKEDITNLLDKYNSISQDFKDKELRNIKYNYFNYLDRYQRYHAHYAKLPNYKVSEHFLDDLKNVIYTDTVDFNFSNAYKQLVTNFYWKQASDLAKKENIDEDLAFLKVVSDNPEEVIKNDLLFSEAKYGITYAENTDAYYKTFMETSTNKKQKEEITKSYNKLKTVSKGQPSPKFVDYENFNGSTTSLNDLKGKYAYIDVWATWCGPCKAEIPSLKEMEKKYHNKNINFVSISVDKAKDRDKWLKMVKEKDLKGYQLFADKDWNSDFVKKYLILGIPRFILIDPEGNIVNSNAPRPSDNELEVLFKSLKI